MRGAAAIRQRGVRAPWASTGHQGPKKKPGLWARRWRWSRRTANFRKWFEHPGFQDVTGFCPHCTTSLKVKVLFLLLAERVEAAVVLS